MGASPAPYLFIYLFWGPYGLLCLGMANLTCNQDLSMSSIHDDTGHCLHRCQAIVPSNSSSTLKVKMQLLGRCLTWQAEPWETCCSEVWARACASLEKQEPWRQEECSAEGGQQAHQHLPDGQHPRKLSERLVFFLLALCFCAVGTYPKDYDIITLLYNNQVVSMRIGRCCC